MSDTAILSPETAETLKEMFSNRTADVIANKDINDVLNDMRDGTTNDVVSEEYARRLCMAMFAAFDHHLAEAMLDSKENEDISGSTVAEWRNYATAALGFIESAKNIFGEEFDAPNLQELVRRSGEIASVPRPVISKETAAPLIDLMTKTGMRSTLLDNGEFIEAIEKLHHGDEASDDALIDISIIFNNAITEIGQLDYRRSEYKTIALGGDDGWKEKYIPAIREFAQFVKDNGLCGNIMSNALLERIDGLGKGSAIAS